MSLLRKLGIGIATVGLAALLIGCDEEQDAVEKAANPQNKTLEVDERYINSDKSLIAEFGEPEKITAQIMDIQEGFVQYAGTIRPYKFLEVKGPEKTILLIYPFSKHFRKYTPAEITFKPIKGGKITSKQFVYRYIGHYGVSSTSNHVIEADGVIEPDGVEYLGETK